MKNRESEIREWKSLEEFFSGINASGISYVVLRNYQPLRTESFPEDHPDIDILCEDPQQFAAQAGAFPRNRRDDGIHYRIRAASREIALDIRSIGDGYLDSRWEKDILDRCTLYEDFCYVPEPADELYSILYHVVIQKKKIAANYRDYILDRFPDMKELTRTELIRRLEQYMAAKGYRYTCPAYPYAVFNPDGIDRKLIRRWDGRWVRRFVLKAVNKVLR